MNLTTNIKFKHGWKLTMWMTMTTWMKGSNWMTLKTNVVHIMDEISKTWMKVTSYPYDWISPSLTWIIFMWSIYLEELSFVHVVYVNRMITFLLYQYCPLYIVNSNQIINFHSFVTVSSISFNVNHVVNFIQVTRFNPMIQFYSCDQVHPNGHPNFTWISYV
jgi:hypothetical protein